MGINLSSSSVYFSFGRVLFSVESCAFFGSLFIKIILLSYSSISEITLFLYSLNKPFFLKNKTKHKNGFLNIYFVLEIELEKDS